MTTVQVIAVTGLPEVEPGDNLGALVAEHVRLRDGDVVVVAQKVVSKAEGALVHVDAADPQARRRLAREQAARIVAESPGVLITETVHGFVCANAGIDASNVPAGQVTLLPTDPDASARWLRADLRQAAGIDVAVVIADTFGRAWRTGQTDIAIGVAGLRPLRDERGTSDRFGRTLDVTETAIADEIAGAADLVRRKAEGVPVVVVRGVAWTPAERVSALDLIRPAELDLFRRGRGGLAAALSADEEIVSPVDDTDFGRAWQAVHARSPGPVTVVDLSRAGRRCTRIGVLADAPGAEPAAGVVAGMLLALLVDQGYLARLADPRADEPAVIVLEAGRGPASTSIH